MNAVGQGRPGEQSFSLTVNGSTVKVRAAPDASLLNVLRNQLGLMGSRFGCGLRMCGACFVRLDGNVVPACDTPIWAAENRTVVTVEGLAANGLLHPVQQAVLKKQAAQCGYCISGILVSAATLLESNPRPTETEVIEALDRNLCRCGVQRRIVQAVLEASDAS